MTSTVLVTGASGFLGRAVFERFQHAGVLVVGQGFSRCAPPTILKADLEQKEDIAKLFDEVKPQIVIHCAANRSPDLCEKNPDQARRVNVEATRTLAKHCQKTGAFIIYISTEYVFPGTEGEAPYEADAPTKPVNLYGQLKLDGEQAILEEIGNSGLGVVLRVPLLYGKAKHNSESAVNVLVDVVQKATEEGAGVNMDDWALRHPTNTEDVARVCHDIVAKYLREKEKRKELPRVLQFSSQDTMTKYGICQKLAQVLGVATPGMIPNKQGNDPNAAVKRPYDTLLSNKALIDLGINVQTADFMDWWRREFGAHRK